MCHCCRKLQTFTILSEEVENDLLLQERGLQGFPQVLCSLTTLERLHFSGQQLLRIPQEISQLTRLSTLTMNA
jgi:Leucine-rich repeat (LRR) protein